MIVLITGKPNVGKTTIIECLKKHYHVFVADEYVKQIYQINQCGYNLIKQCFGDAYVTATAVDTAKLSALIFEQPAMRLKLNNLIWPVLKAKILQLKNTNKNYLIEMAIYLVDDQHLFDNVFDKVIEITADFITDNQKQKFSAYYTQHAAQPIDFTVKNTQVEKTVKTISDYLQMLSF